MVVHGLSQQIDDSLLAGGAVCRADILLGKHARVLFGSVGLRRDHHVEEAFDLQSRNEEVELDSDSSRSGGGTYVLLDRGKLLLQGFLLLEHSAHLVEHILQALHHPSLEVYELAAVGLLVNLFLDFASVALKITLQLRQILSELGDFFFHVFEQISSHSGIARKRRSLTHGLDFLVKEGNRLLETGNQLLVFIGLRGHALHQLMDLCVLGLDHLFSLVEHVLDGLHLVLGVG